tara:strand:+ start:124 stop:240 length:117 start_codon:yes stop_codon:yes gene_type:complete
MLLIIKAVGGLILISFIVGFIIYFIKDYKYTYKKKKKK